MSDAAVPAVGGSSEPKPPRVVIHKDETAYIEELCSNYFSILGVVIEPAAHVEQRVMTRASFAVAPPPAPQSRTAEAVYAFVQPLFLLKFPDAERVVKTCSLARVKTILSKPVSSTSASDAPATLGALATAQVGVPVVVSPINLKTLRLQGLELAAKQAAEALAADIANASTRTAALSSFASRDISEIRLAESEGTELNHKAAEEVAKRLTDRSTRDASAASIPLLRAMADALQKAANCGWEWATSAEAEERVKLAVSYDTVLLILDGPDTLKRKALESDPNREEREDLSEASAIARRSAKNSFNTGCKAFAKAVASDQRAADKLTQNILLAQQQKNAKRGESSTPSTAITASSSSASAASAGVVSPNAEAAAAAAAATAAKMQEQRLVVFTKLQKSIDEVSIGFRDLSNLCGRDKSLSSAASFLFSGDSGSVKPFFSTNITTVNLSAGVHDAVSLQQFSKDALHKIASSMFECQVSDINSRPKRDDRVYGVDDFKASSKKNKGADAEAEAEAQGYGVEVVL